MNKLHYEEAKSLKWTKLWPWCLWNDTMWHFHIIMKAILEYKEMETYNNYGEVWNHIQPVCLMGSDIKHACEVSPRSCQFGMVLLCMCTCWILSLHSACTQAPWKADNVYLHETLHRNTPYMVFNTRVRDLRNKFCKLQHFIYINITISSMGNTWAIGFFTQA